MLRMTIPLVLTGFLVPVQVETQERLESWGSGSAWRVSAGVPAGTIAGLVLNWDGEPLRGAQVSLVGARPWALTDEDGRFSLTPPFGGRWELQLSYLGAVALDVEVVVPWDHGVFVTAMLHRLLMHGLCGYGILGLDDLNIRVRDAGTGGEFEGLVTLRLEHETGDWTNRVELKPDAPPYGRMGLGRRIETEGLHSIEISAPGYQRWRVDDVFLRQVPGCTLRLLNRDHEAWLEPIR